MHILLLGPQKRNAAIRLYLESRQHRVSTSEDKLDLAQLKMLAVDLIISNGYAPIIGAEIVASFSSRILNLHATYLPWGKGIGALLFCLLEGAPIGVTIHLIDQGVDTGDVLFRKRITYSRDTCVRQLYTSLLTEMEVFFKEIWPAIERGQIPPIPQKELCGGSPYRTRLSCEKFLDLLSERWDVKAELLEHWAVEFARGEQFRLTVNEGAGNEQV